jgi:hypothetical protein
MRHEVDRFLATLQDSTSSRLVMADGGLLVADLNRALSDATWQRIRDEFFGESSQAEEAES